MIALPLAAAVLPLAFAQTAAADQVYTPANASQLSADVNAANSAGGFNIIELNNSGYAITSQMVVTGHLEITGPPKGTATGGHTYNITGTAVSPPPPPALPDTIQVASGANLILKALDLQACGVNTPSEVDACIRVMSGGNVSLDNMSIVNPADVGLIVQTGATAELNNSSVFASDVDGIHVQSGASLTLNNATVAENIDNGLVWQPGANITTNNALIAQDDGSGNGFQDCSIGGLANAGPVPTADAPTDISSMDSDGTCDVAHSDDTFTNLGQATLGQGPSEFLTPGAGDGSGQSDAQGAGNSLTCQNDDQTFYLLQNGNCDDGSFQSQTVPDTDSTGPVCTVPPVVNGSPNPFESTNSSVPSTEQVNATSSGPGLGPDVITNAASVLKSSPTTVNGTVGWPVIPGTLFDETNSASTTHGAGGATILQDEPSTAPFPVTAQKPLGDVTANDTQWQFDATDWLGNTTLCK